MFIGDEHPAQNIPVSERPSLRSLNLGHLAHGIYQYFSQLSLVFNLSMLIWQTGLGPCSEHWNQLTGMTPLMGCRPGNWDESGDKQYIA